MYQKNDFGDKKERGRKGFYWSVCVAMVCLLAVGTVYYRNQSAENTVDKTQLANEAKSTSPAGSAGKSAIDSKDKSVPKKGQTDNLEDSQAASVTVNQTAKPVHKKGQKEANDKKASNKTDKTIADKKNEKGNVSKQTKQTSAKIQSGFNEEKGLSWPVKGDVIMKYSLSNTTYFKTLAQYKCNPAIEIAAENGTKVSAAADGKVTKISHEEETGNTVMMDLGNGYSVVYGQLKDVKVKEGQSVKEGEVIGKIAEPTKYFSEEGSNLYLQVMQNDKTVDPLLLLH